MEGHIEERAGVETSTHLLGPKVECGEFVCSHSSVKPHMLPEVGLLGTGAEDLGRGQVQRTGGSARYRGPGGRGQVQGTGGRGQVQKAWGRGQVQGTGGAVVRAWPSL